MAKITVQVGTTEPIDTTIRPASYMRASPYQPPWAIPKVGAGCA
jgi:hypothetical protein